MKVQPQQVNPPLELRVQGLMNRLVNISASIPDTRGIKEAMGDIITVLIGGTPMQPLGLIDELVRMVKAERERADRAEEQVRRLSEETKIAGKISPSPKAQEASS